MKGQIMDTRLTGATVSRLEVPRSPRHFESAWPEPARIKLPEPGGSNWGDFSLVPAPVFVMLLAMKYPDFSGE